MGPFQLLSFLVCAKTFRRWSLALFIAYSGFNFYNWQRNVRILKELSRHFVSPQENLQLNFSFCFDIIMHRSYSAFSKNFMRVKRNLSHLPLVISMSGEFVSNKDISQVFKSGSLFISSKG